MHLHKILIAAAAAVALVVSTGAQDAPKTERPESPKAFKALKYRTIGPAAGGRVSRARGRAGRSR